MKVQVHVGVMVAGLVDVEIEDGKATSVTMGSRPEGFDTTCILSKEKLPEGEDENIRKMAVHSALLLFVEGMEQMNRVLLSRHESDTLVVPKKGGYLV